MFEKVAAMYRYFLSVVPFRLTPAIICTVVLVTLLVLPAPEGLKPERGIWSASS